MQNDNHINYIELYTTNIETSKEFYSAVFNWTFTDYGQNYVAFSNSGLKGGIEKADTVMTGGPLVVLYHSDLESVKNLVTSHGGDITKDIFSFPGGERFEFTDPVGNMLAVWKTL